MILKRIEKEDGNIVKAIYKSSNVLASKYNKTTGELTITFNKGTQYTYAGVSATDYMRFEISESQGAELNTNIKKYQFTKGEDVDVALIIEEVNKFKQAEIKDIEEKIVKQMDASLKAYAKKEIFDDVALSNLQYLISKLQREKNS